MATYTLSHTGAEVDAAVNNATNLFTTAHTWTANQTFTNIGVNISQGALSVTSGATLMVTTGSSLEVKPGGSLRVLGASSFSVEGSSGTFTVTPDATFQSSIFVTGDVSAGSATINGETDISGDLIVTGDLSASGPATFATITGTDITGNRIESTLDLIAGRSIRINSDKVTISFETSAGTMPGDGVYISTSGLTVVAEGAAYPANVLLIVFDY